MRAITRQTSRLCYRVIKRRTRAFSTTSRPLDWRPQEETKTKTTTTAQENADEVAENSEGRRSGFKRTLRQRKITDIPTPPPLPAWFLKRNVILRDDEERKNETSNELVLSCIEEETGRVLFQLPYTPESISLLRGDNQTAEEAAQLLKDAERLPALGSSSETSSSLESTQSSATIDDGTDKAVGAQKIENSNLQTPSPKHTAAIQAEIIARAIFATAGQSISTFAASKSDISLVSYDINAHNSLDKLIVQLAHTLDADTITLDANDLADLTEEYVGQGNDLPGTFSTLSHDVFEGQVSAKIGAPFTMDVSSMFGRGESDHNEDREMDEDEEDDEEDEDKDDASSKIQSLQDILKSNVGGLDKGLGRIPAIALSFAVPAGVLVGRASSKRKQTKESDSDYVQWDDARLTSVFEQILNAPFAKRQNASSEQNRADSASRHATEAVESEAAQASAKDAKLEATHAIAKLLFTNQTESGALSEYKYVHKDHTTSPQASDETRRTILHLKDLHNIVKTKLGEAVIRRLTKVVQKRRRLGEEVIIIATSVQATPFALEAEDSFITIPVPRTISNSTTNTQAHPTVGTIIKDRGYDRILEINMRNIGSMIRKVQPNEVYDDLFTLPQDQMLSPGVNLLVERTLSQSQVHRLVLFALGLTQTYAPAKTIQPVHVSIAAATISTSGADLDRLKSLEGIGERIKSLDQDIASLDDSKISTGKEKLDKIKSKCNTHETRLLAGVVDAQNIKTGFKDVHVAPATIEALKTSTSLALQRPDAFKYGILAADNLSGLMLYGPPGTGKTLLAKAVAKESKASVLEISGAQIYEKYVGEGEKMVRAVFTLAKKLSPCVVFIDEADALFGARSASGNRTTHREILNQFLREWDGMDDRRVFVMVATNRPFDVDDAVLRRLPRRLLVDLPSAKDREGIFGIHLRGEDLDPEISLQNLAEQTALYSGSDLKNVCVAAALAAVQDENALIEEHKDDSEFKLPEKRVLLPKHFEKALREISASISEDMSSLNAIRKFDEQYGDRGGRKKKVTYGFGASEAGVDENAARIRQGP